MQIRELTIENFRGIKSGRILFSGHSLLIGGNNVGKSTVCEAIDLTLGAERLNRQPPINEHDFFDRQYLDEEENEIHIKIRVLISDLSSEVLSQFNYHHDYWDTKENRLLNKEEDIDLIDESHVIDVMGIEFLGWYNKEEDEFEAKTYFISPINEDLLQRSRVSREYKRKLGFLFLRTLRTGSRALSLEKGSLLDLILKLKEENRNQMWEETIKSLENLDPPVHEITQISEILDEIEERVNSFIKLSEGDHRLGFYASNLTREHLRKFITFFATSEYTGTLVPFQQLGTGAINTFVFSLLTFVADLNSSIRGNVIFAMEEPEIAIPPHTQRRIVRYILKNMDQVVSTSHSPYILEQFEPRHVTVLTRDSNGVLTSTNLDVKDIKLKNFQGGIRHRYAEALLGKGVLLVEGQTELSLFPAASEIMEEDPDYTPIDISGVTVVSVGGDGALATNGKFFKGLGMKTYAFFDKQKKDKKTLEDIYDSFDSHIEIDQSGIEKYLCDTVPKSVQIDFMNKAKDFDDFPEGILSRMPEKFAEEDVSSWCLKVLKARKGAGYAAHLIYLIDLDDLPEEIDDLLWEISEEFPAYRNDDEESDENIVEEVEPD